eukprot:CAMPEP_0170596818 /NCGR_PEP_ID=MMETSP0224-20130122/15345_1 /TAXON_ID=285029 /ORGANISM="Togula jolla, Strain CCCM 725" /LENGTH=279 /DNA_ID=CAMNT_0010921185 /DNA_START=235 /DNA_END=1074 /DNA_ORIENTATION=+
MLVTDPLSFGIVGDPLLDRGVSLHILRSNLVDRPADLLQCLSKVAIEAVLQAVDLVVLGRLLSCGETHLGNRAPVVVHVRWILLGNEAHELGEGHVSPAIHHDPASGDLSVVSTAKPVPGVPDEGEGECPAHLLSDPPLNHLRSAAHLILVPALLYMGPRWCWVAPTSTTAWLGRPALDSGQHIVHSSGTDLRIGAPKTLLAKHDHVSRDPHVTIWTFHLVVLTAWSCLQPFDALFFYELCLVDLAADIVDGKFQPGCQLARQSNGPSEYDRKTSCHGL